MRKEPATYIMTNRYHTVLYVGVTSNLRKRVWQHKTHFYKGFTYRYNVHYLVYYERHPTMLMAIHREKRLKHVSRAIKIALIEGMNPEWHDLYESIGGYSNS